MPKRRSLKPKGESDPVSHAVHFDRIEADDAGQERAVLILDDGRAMVVPRDLLPAGVDPGSTLRWTLSSDDAATAATAHATAEIRATLKRSDPGGTIHL